MGLSSFFGLRGTILEKILKILCLICWGIGGIIYIYGIYEAIISSTIFPSGSNLVSAPWALHVGLRFFVLWVPMGFALIQWQMKRIVVLAVYLAGCVLAILFSILALTLILKYAESDTSLQKEYIELVKAEQKTGKFPSSVAKMIEPHKCCSWFGPQDFAPGSLFDISEKQVNEDLEFMRNVAKCYGGVFTVKNSGGNGVAKVKYEPDNSAKKEIPKGCSGVLIDTAMRTTNFIFSTAIIVTILSLVIIVLYVLNYLKLPSTQVGFQNAQMQQQQYQNFPPSDDVEPAPAGGPSDAPSVFSVPSS